MWSEHLHAETATDVNQERLADLARHVFAEAEGRASKAG
jgi:hypothetical protein